MSHVLQLTFYRWTTKQQKCCTVHIGGAINGNVFNHWFQSLLIIQSPLGLYVFNVFKSTTDSLLYLINRKDLCNVQSNQLVITPNKTKYEHNANSKQ